MQLIDLTNLPDEIQRDIDTIQRIDAVPTILNIVCQTTGMGFAAIARVTDDRWVTCSARDDIGFGLVPGSELKLETTICNEIRQSGTPVIIDQVSRDDAYRAHHTPAMYGFESYISMPIQRRTGEFFGTLCAIDPRPAQVSRPEVVGMFRMFADLIAFHIETQERWEQSEARLLDAHETARLREQFIAVLGHDLRNPLAAIGAGVQMLGKNPSPERFATLAMLMRQSVDRMGKLIDNVLDFARGRLGKGIGLDIRPNDLSPILTHVVEELRSNHPRRHIELKLDLPDPVLCDGLRVAQLASNLVANALTYGAPDLPVTVEARATGHRFELEVCNGGAEIPAAKLARVFEPFERVADNANNAGLGLGLYISSEIAKAHGGSLSAKSSPALTCFTFTMPLQPAAENSAPHGAVI